MSIMPYIIYISNNEAHRLSPHKGGANPEGANIRTNFYQPGREAMRCRTGPTLRISKELVKTTIGTTPIQSEARLVETKKVHPIRRARNRPHVRPRFPAWEDGTKCAGS